MNEGKKGKIIKLENRLPSFTEDVAAGLRAILPESGVAIGGDGVESVWCDRCKALTRVYTTEGHYICSQCNGLSGFPVPAGNPWHTPGGWLKDCSGFQVNPYRREGEEEVRYE